MAISLLLLIGAGLFVRSLSNLKSLDPGFKRESVLLVYDESVRARVQEQRIRDYYDRLIGAPSYACRMCVSRRLANITPLGGSRWNSGVSVEGYTRTADEKTVDRLERGQPGLFRNPGNPDC